MMIFLGTTVFLTFAVKSTSSLSVILNHPVLLPCSNSSCGNFTWRKVSPIDAAVAECDKQECTVNGDFKERFNLTDNCSLLLSSSKYNDRGTYECICCDITKYVELEILVPINMTAVESGNITLQCYADTQVNTYNVTWLHNSSKILDCTKHGYKPGKGFEGRVSLTEDGFKYGDLSLTITGVQKTDAGLYRCISNNTKDKGYPNTYMLHVNENPASGENQTENSSFKIGIIIGVLVLFLIIFFYKLYKCKTRPSESVQESDPSSTRPFHDTPNLEMKD